MERCPDCNGRAQTPKMMADRQDCQHPIHDGYHLTDDEAN